MGSAVAGVVLAAFASVLFNLAIVIQAGEVRAVPGEYGLKLSLIGRLLRRPRWLLGSAMGLTAFPLQTAALLLAPLTAVQPADAAGLLVLLFLGARRLGERVGPRETAAVVGIAVGIAVITATAPRRHVTDVAGAEVLLPMVGVAALAAAPIVLRRFTASASLVVVLGAGFAFALGAFCAKIVADALDRSAWLVVALALVVAAGAALVGTVSEQTALQQRQATQVAPLIFAIELLVPIALAVIVVGEDWERKSLIGILSGLALVVAGAISLARTPTVARLMEAGP
jgi:drug/metabolite transporter (DMT)-like permease